MTVEEIKLIKEKTGVNDEYINFLQEFDFKIATKDEILDVVKTEYLPHQFENYFWVITEKEITLEESLDVQLPMLCKANVKTQKNIYTHYHSCLIVLGDVKANIIFTDGETHLMGTSRFNAIIADNGGGPEFYVKEPIGKLAWMDPDSSSLNARDKIDVLYYNKLEEYKGDLSGVLKKEYFTINNEALSEEIENQNIEHYVIEKGKVIEKTDLYDPIEFCEIMFSELFTNKIKEDSEKGINVFV